MTDPQRIGVVIIGCGYMGGSGVLAYERLKEVLPADGIQPEIVAVVEPKFETYTIVGKYCFDKLWPVPQCYRDLAAALPGIVKRSYSEDLPILVYDAAPPKYHQSHLATLHDYIATNGDHDRPFKLIYIGEKPIATDPNEIISMQNLTNDLPIFCEFIEGTNPAYEALQKYIVDKKLTIESMKFWRASGGGTKIFIGAQRPGVQGGALLDKAPHDLSISMNLLGSVGVTGRLKQAHVHFLIPAYGTQPTGEGRAVVNTQNDPVRELTLDLERRLNLPADGMSSLTIDWSRNEHDTVRGDYLFSWLGLTGHPLEESFFQELISHGISRSDVVLTYKKCEGEIDRHPLSPGERAITASGEAASAVIEEVRIGIIRCADRTIICNLLEKDKKVGAINRFLVEHIDGEPPHRLPIPASTLSGFSLKGSELARVFKSIIDFTFGGPEPVQYGKHVTLVTHELLFAAQDLALSKLQKSQFDEYFSKAFDLVQTKVQKIPGTAAS